MNKRNSLILNDVNEIIHSSLLHVVLIKKNVFYTLIDMPQDFVTFMNSLRIKVVPSGC